MWQAMVHQHSTCQYLILLVQLHWFFSLFTICGTDSWLHVLRLQKIFWAAQTLQSMLRFHFCHLLPCLFLWMMKVWLISTSKRTDMETHTLTLDWGRHFPWRKPDAQFIQSHASNRVKCSTSRNTFEQSYIWNRKRLNQPRIQAGLSVVKDDELQWSGALGCFPFQNM